MSDCRELLREARAAIYGFDVADLIARIDAFLATPAAPAAPSERLLDARLEFLASAPDGEVAEYIRERGGDPNDPATDVEQAIDRALAAASAAPAEPVALLPCDVTLEPRMIIRKGCKLSTLIHALERRGMNAAPPPPGAEAEDAALVAALGEALADAVRMLKATSFKHAASIGVYQRLAVDAARRAQEAKR